MELLKKLMSGGNVVTDHGAGFLYVAADRVAERADRHDELEL